MSISDYNKGIGAIKMQSVDAFFVVDHQRKARLMNQKAQDRPEPPILWVDGVGGYLMLDQDDLLIGQASAGTRVQIGIVGDLSRQAAILKRRQSDYFIDPVQETDVDGRPIDSPYLLRSGAVLRWGDRIQLRFLRPHPLSASARLDLVSLHRFRPRVDGVLLMADSCILGPSASSHVVCPGWNRDLLMYKGSGQWFFRSLDSVEVDGKSLSGDIPVARGMRMRGEDFSLSVE